MRLGTTDVISRNALQYTLNSHVCWRARVVKRAIYGCFSCIPAWPTLERRKEGEGQAGGQNTSWAALEKTSPMETVYMEGRVARNF